MDESPMISPNHVATDVSPPPSEGPGPLIFDEDQSELEQRSPSMLSDEMRRTPSPMNTTDTKMY